MASASAGEDVLPLPSERYDFSMTKGMYLLNQGQYSESEEMFHAALADRHNDAKAIYYLGMVEGRQEKYAHAAARFLYAASLKPKWEATARYQAGLALYKQGAFEEARQQFLLVTQMTPHSYLGASADRFLIEPRKNKSPGRWGFRWMTGYSYDDNVALEPSDGPFLSENQDSRLTFLFNGDYQWGMNRPSGRIGYSFFKSLQKELDAFDIESHQPHLLLLHKGEVVSGRFDYNYLYMTAGGAPYLRSHTVRPMASFLSVWGWTPNCFYQFQSKDFRDSSTFQSGASRDGINNMAGLSAEWVGGGKKFKTEASYEVENTRLDEWDYRGYRVATRASVQLPAAIQGGIGVDFFHRNYPFKHPLLSLQQGREDRLYTATARLSKSLFQGVDISAEIVHLRNNSNISLFENRRNISSLNLTGRF